MKKTLLIILLASGAYTQCNESNWEEYYPEMQGCSLSGANLSEADLFEADLSDANLSYAFLIGADLRNANLSYANLYQADLTVADLIEANLSHANLVFANLSYANLLDADLSYTYLNGANLNSTWLNGACLEGATGFNQADYNGTPILEGCAGGVPAAYGSSHTLDEDTTATIGLFATDEDGDVLTYAIVSEPQNGTLNLAENLATYIPSPNYNGTDSFQFQADDGQTSSNIATVTLTVNAVNDSPYLYPIEDATSEGEPFVYNLQAQDVDGDALVYTVTFSGGSATANITENILTIVPQESNVILSVVATVSDGNATHSTSFSLTVLEEGQGCSDNNGDGLVDGFPIIYIVDGNAQVLIQGSQDYYIDSGATCSDQEDGDIWHQVEVSGDVVNINVPNTYTLVYNCSDSDGNAAQTKHRTVFVIAQNGDLNEDTELNVVDIVNLVNLILGEAE